MTKKKNKETFASRARKIRDTYKRAEFDPIEQADMEADLQRLMKEQETVRESMGLTQPQEGMPQEQFKGESKMYPNGGRILPNYTEEELGRMMGYTDFRNNMPINAAIAPTVGGAGKAFKPSMGAFRAANRRITTQALKEEQIMSNLIKAPGALAKQFPTGVKNLNNLTGKLPSTSYNIPWGNIGIGVGTAGILGGGAYGVSQIPFNNNQGQSNQGNTNKLIDLTGYDLQSVLDYTNSLYPQGTPPLTPQQLAQTSQSLQRPNQQTSTGQSRSRGNIGVSSVNQAEINRNPNERWMANEADMVANNIGNRIQPTGIAGEGYQSPSEMAAAMNQLTVQGQPTSSQGGGQSWWNKNKQYAPYALSGLSNIASNLLMANMAKRNQPRMSAAMATPEKINLEPQAEALRGQAGVSKNIASRNARNLGLNPMQAMASMSAAGTGIDRNLGDTLTNLYMQQEGANVGAANQFSMMNAQAQNRANMVNTQLDQEGLNKRLGYTGAALGTLPGVMKDIRMDKADKDMRDVMRSYYESMGRNYMVEGDIFEKDGFRYKVKNNKLKKVGKVK